MATKFLTLKKDKIVENTSENKTKFSKAINTDGRVTEAVRSPSYYENVLFLGKGQYYGDVFLAWGKKPEEYIIYFGTKGDEFPE